MSNEPAQTTTKKILVVDDDKVVVKALTTRLSAEGFQTVAAHDGAGAVQAVRNERPDLIVLDITFPPPEDVYGVMWDGFLVMEWLQRMDESRNIPVIVISGGQPAELDDRSKAVGAVAIFHKPIDHDQLLEAIRKALQ